MHSIIACHTVLDYGLFYLQSPKKRTTCIRPMVIIRDQISTSRLNVSDINQSHPTEMIIDSIK